VVEHAFDKPKSLSNAIGLGLGVVVLFLCAPAAAGVVLTSYEVRSLTDYTKITLNFSATLKYTSEARTSGHGQFLRLHLPNCELHEELDRVHKIADPRVADLTMKPSGNGLDATLNLLQIASYKIRTYTFASLLNAFKIVIYLDGTDFFTKHAQQYGVPSEQAKAEPRTPPPTVSSPPRVRPAVQKPEPTPNPPPRPLVPPEPPPTPVVVPILEASADEPKTSPSPPPPPRPTPSIVVRPDQQRQAPPPVPKTRSKVADTRPLSPGPERMLEVATLPGGVITPMRSGVFTVLDHDTLPAEDQRAARQFGEWTEGFPAPLALSLTELFRELQDGVGSLPPRGLLPTEVPSTTSFLRSTNQDTPVDPRRGSLLVLVVLGEGVEPLQGNVLANALFVLLLHEGVLPLPFSLIRPLASRAHVPTAWLEAKEELQSAVRALGITDMVSVVIEGRRAERRLQYKLLAVEDGSIRLVGTRLLAAGPGGLLVGMARAASELATHLGRRVLSSESPLGLVSLRSRRPIAHILAGTVRLGRPPLSVLLPLGRETVLHGVTMEGYFVEQRLRPGVEGEEFWLSEAAKTTLCITSSPSGATVAVNGQPAGLTPLPAYLVPPGEHRIRVAKTGYRPVERVLEVQLGQAGVELSVQLEVEP